ncbi:MAG: hypothetical protein IBX63_10105 [Coriobacteriia bacterium]|nr:hypothetical protein [Coriobacteriia bacterium]
MLEILEHLDNPQDAVYEALRVARHRVVVTVPAKGHMLSVPGHIQDFEVADLIAMFPSVLYARQHKPFTFLVHERPSVSRARD